MRDFNEKLGKKEDKKATVMGNFETGNRYERRRTLMDFALKKQLTNNKQPLLQKGVIENGPGKDRIVLQKGK